MAFLEAKNVESRISQHCFNFSHYKIIFLLSIQKYIYTDFFPSSFYNSHSLFFSRFTVKNPTKYSPKFGKSHRTCNVLHKHLKNIKATIFGHFARPLSKSNNRDIYILIRIMSRKEQYYLVYYTFLFC